MKTNNYHDREVIGILFKESKKELELICKDSTKIIFRNVIQFEMSFFSDQNVLFDIEKYKIESVPMCVIEDFPFLEHLLDFYKEKSQQRIFVYNLISSIGLSGVVITNENTCDI